MLLWDFEVARRLFRQGGKIVHELDDLPIGVAIARILRLLQGNTQKTFNTFLSIEKLYIFGEEPETRRNNIKTILQESRVAITVEKQFLQVSSIVRGRSRDFVTSARG